MNVLLNQFPPAPFPEAREHGMAKLLLDAFLHEHHAAFRKPVQKYFRGQVDKVIRELETEKVEKGVRIWKIYDMAFIARTKSVTIAFDLVSGITSGSADFAMTPGQIERLARQCDALLITHRHQDHAEMAVAQQFISLGLPVVTNESVWKNEPVFSQIIHLERNQEKIHKLKLKSAVIDLIVFPGHQMKSIDNNVYWVKTPEDITLVRKGDQINEGDFMVDWEWIDKVGKNHKVDVLIPNAGTMDIMRIVKGFNPKLVMPGNELELGHTAWNRLPFWGGDEYLGLNYAGLKKSTYPGAITVWGESYHYAPK